jgi:hypothetical protein
VASPHSAKIAGHLVVETEGSGCGSRPNALTLTLALNEGSASPDTYVYLPSEVIDAAATWQDLPTPAGATSLVTIYVRASNRRDTYRLRITRTTAGVQTLGPLRGTAVIEFDPDDPATLIEVQGELTLAYLGLADT